jgi:hypothetical protein
MPPLVPKSGLSSSIFFTRLVFLLLILLWFILSCLYSPVYLIRSTASQVHTLVESFCKEQGVTYHEASIYEGTVEVLSHLAEVSAEFVREFPAM